MEWTARLHMAVFGVVVVLGALAGAGLALLYPPVLSSRAVVLEVAKNAAGEKQLAAIKHIPVLLNPRMSPPPSYVDSDSYVLEITGKARTAAGAQDAASAAARSYARRVSSPDIRAVVLDPATPATGTTMPVWVAGFAMLGALAGAGAMIMWRPVLSR